MRRLLLLAATAFVVPLAAHADPLFVLGQNFTVNGTGSPTNFNDVIPFTVGNHLLDGGLLNLNINIVPATGGAEWAVFTYTTVGGGPISPTGGNWSLNQVGIPSAVALNFIGDATQFFSGSTVLTQSPNGVFGQTLMPNPVPGGPAGQAEGTLGFVAPFPVGPLPSLGAFINPFSQLSSHGINPASVTGFSQALEFVAQVPLPPVGAPEPASMAMLGVGLLGLGFLRPRKQG